MSNSFMASIGNLALEIGKTGAKIALPVITDWAVSKMSVLQAIDEETTFSRVIDLGAQGSVTITFKPKDFPPELVEALRRDSDDYTYTSKIINLADKKSANFVTVASFADISILGGYLELSI